LPGKITKKKGKRWTPNRGGGAIFSRGEQQQGERENYTITRGEKIERHQRKRLREPRRMGGRPGEGTKVKKKNDGSGWST